MTLVNVALSKKLTIAILFFVAGMFCDHCLSLFSICLHQFSVALKESQLPFIILNISHIH